MWKDLVGIKKSKNWTAILWNSNQGILNVFRMLDWCIKEGIIQVNRLMAMWILIKQESWMVGDYWHRCSFNHRGSQGGKYCDMFHREISVRRFWPIYRHGQRGSTEVKCATVKPMCYSAFSFCFWGDLNPKPKGLGTKRFEVHSTCHPGKLALVIYRALNLYILKPII